MICQTKVQKHRGAWILCLLLTSATSSTHWFQEKWELLVEKLCCLRSYGISLPYDLLTATLRNALGWKLTRALKEQLPLQFRVVFPQQHSTTIPTESKLLKPINWQPKPMNSAQSAYYVKFARTAQVNNLKRMSNYVEKILFSEERRVLEATFLAERGWKIGNI